MPGIVPFFLQEYISKTVNQALPRDFYYLNITIMTKIEIDEGKALHSALCYYKDANVFYHTQQ